MAINIRERLNRLSQRSDRHDTIVDMPRPSFIPLADRLLAAWKVYTQRKFHITHGLPPVTEMLQQAQQRVCLSKYLVATLNEARRLERDDLGKWAHELDGWLKNDIMIFEIGEGW